MSRLGVHVSQSVNAHEMFVHQLAVKRELLVPLMRLQYQAGEEVESSLVVI